jgi:DNA-binding NtrC family response regulator
VLVLVADSDQRSRSMIDATLGPMRGVRVVSVSGAEQALASIEKGCPDLLITDLELADGSGISVLDSALRGGAKGIVTSGFFDEKTTINILGMGNTRILEKPLDKKVLVAQVEALFGDKKQSQEQTERAALLAASAAAVKPVNKRRANLPSGPDQIVGSSPNWLEVMGFVKTVSDTDAEVLILGESGTGKELIARALHVSSERASGPFIAVNCAAVPEALLESEMFGHVKGAYTGALKPRKGLFVAADGGTIFLDEIGEMPLKLQSKLLRVLQEKTFLPVGSDSETRSDFRLVAATNANLEQAVVDGQFREDLYYRLFVFPIHLPPLRQRTDDILALVDYFCARFNAVRRRRVSGFCQPLLDAFQKYTWPGNVRQLENTIDRLVILTAEGEVGLQHLPTDLRQKLLGEKGAGSSGPFATEPEIVDRGPAGSPPGDVKTASQLTGEVRLTDKGIALKELLSTLEWRLIDAALKRTDDNRNRAAKLLGMNRTTLVEKLKKRPS